MSGHTPQFDPNRTLHGYTFDPNRTLHGYTFDPNRTLHGYTLQGRYYDTWTFERWAQKRARRARQIRRRRALVAVAGLTLLVGALLLLGGWLRARRPLLRWLSPPAPSRPLAGVTVVLDPGHGGEDPGASLQLGGDTISEATLAYRTTRAVADSLRAQGADVRYTVRSRALDPQQTPDEAVLPSPTDAVLVATDKPLTARIRRSPRQLWQRAELARRLWEARPAGQGANDLFFLSLHYDESRDPNVHGGLVYVDPRVPGVPILAQTLAGAMKARGWARAETFRGYGGVGADELGVLNPRQNPVPQKALLEVATLTNPDDLQRAEDPAWRHQLGELVAQAIVDAHRQAK